MSVSVHDPRSPVHWLAFGLGSGHAPRAPGTFGTLAAVPLWWLLAQTPAWLYLVVTLLAIGVGVWLCGRTARDLAIDDHPGIVFDEITGFLVAMFAAPVTAVAAIAGFVLFRFFDIVKPWPIRWLDTRLGGGIGIMADDLLAGIYTAVVLAVLLYLLPA